MKTIKADKRQLQRIVRHTLHEVESMDPLGDIMEEIEEAMTHIRNLQHNLTQLSNMDPDGLWDEWNDKLDQLDGEMFETLEDIKEYS